MTRRTENHPLMKHPMMKQSAASARNVKWLETLAVLALLAAAAPLCARGQTSIFDDGPGPSSGATVKPGPGGNGARAAPRPGAVTGLQPGGAPVNAGGATPVPGADVLAKEERQVRETFRADYAKTAPADRAALAGKLLEAADRNPASSAPRYVMLREARDLASSAGAVEPALQAVSRLTQTFALDPLASRLDTMLKLSRSASAPEARQSLAQAALATFDEAQRSGKYEFIGRLAAVCDAAGQGLGPTALGVQLRRKAETARLLKVEFDKAKAAAARLRRAPTDGDRAAAAGLFLCLAHGDWQTGLPMVALSTNPSLKSAAAGETSKPSDPAGQLPLADAWVEASKLQTGYLRTLCEQRAAYWYRAMLPTAGEDARLELEQKIEALPGQIPFSKIAAAVKAGRFEKVRAAGGKTGDAFSDAPEAGALLSGLIVSQRSADGAAEILNLKPIYQAADGRKLGEVIGVVATGSANRAADSVTAEALEGYGVGAIHVRGTDHIEAIRLVFMRTRPTGLDSSSSYESEWIGNARSSAPETVVSSEGKFTIGLHGTTGPELKSLGLTRMK